ncbi:ATP-dependent RNA helicase DDX1-like [Montipora foliosa]|uniref:ATP-dependent RNA helicase DDX1-like n=1 Tax=Montipora foliosa TaxID=591990 RepID=UPI0035F15352
MAGHFSEFGLLPEMCKAVEDMDWLLPTDVQAEAIPLILGGGDVLMAAETGSGKTGAFSLPVIQIVHETVRDALSGNKTSRPAASAGAVIAPTTFKMNPFDRDQELAIDEKGYLCQSRSHFKWQGCRSTLGVKQGRYYYEATVTDEGLCRIGWATDLASLDLGTDKQGFGFGGTGKKSFGRQFDTYGEPFGINDTIGCYLDLDNGSIKFSKNGKDFGDAFEISHNLEGSTFFAAVVLKNAEMSFNFGDSAFKYPPKGGYVGLSKAPRNAVSASNIKGASTSVQSKPIKFGNRCRPSAIIMEPSRELAQQTHNQVSKFKKYLPSPQVKEVLLIGGESVKTQVQMLNEGVDIVTGTPGKLDDFISTDKINLSQVRFFVLDEADGLLAQGNQDLILKIFNKIPKMSPDGKRLQMIVCSATLHSFEVKKLAEKIMHFPTWIDLKGKDSVPETVHHVVCHVDPRVDTSWQKLRNKVKTDGIHAKDNVKSGSQTPESLSEAVKILKVEYLVTAINEHKMDQAIIFCRTKLDCDNVENHLMSLGGGPKAMVNEYSCVCLHSDRSPPERKANLQAFKDGDVRFLICTDVAARGIDITGVPFVVNVTFPDDKQNYVHRIGRVGRAERMGLAISIVSDVKEKVWYHSCPKRGKGCFDTRLKDHGGCAIWYDERQYLTDVEEHLGETISAIQPNMRVPINEFDGKVNYGQKRRGSGSLFDSHTAELAPSVRELADMEFKAQTSFLGFLNRDWMKH